MAEHATYWTALVDKGRVVAFGPVLDPDGVWGLAVVEADGEESVRKMGIEDPAVLSDLASFEVHPMPGAVVRGRP